MKEIWKEIAYPGYFISNLGRLKGRSGKIIKSYINKRTGYKMIAIKPNGRNGKAKCLKIHRLVAEAFIPNPNNLPVINHIDGNKINNNTSNLEWCTFSENNLHAIRLGLVNIKRQQGCNNVKSTLTEEDVKWIREHYIPHDKNFGTKVLAKRFNIAHTNISRLIRKEKYKNI